MKSTKNGKMKEFRKSMQQIWSWNGRAEGQFFDKNTYVGCIRSIVLMSIFVYIGWHLDDIERWMDAQYYVSSVQEAWHRIVVVGIGLASIIFDLINIYNVYANRRKIPSSDSE